MKTSLYDKHAALGAKMGEFCGWEMPIQYKGLIQEHSAVRQGVGIFDVSHMGCLAVEGNEAESFLDYVSTNRISGKENLTATYSVLCHAHGGCVDDVIIYKQTPQHFFVVGNAANRLKDFEHLKREGRRFNVDIRERFREDGIIAIQGPKSKLLLSQFFPAAAALRKMHFIPLPYQSDQILLSRTGYTGEEGFEIYGPNAAILQLWELFLQEGKMYGLEPVGLGARDTLRLEMGYALYGHEINDAIAPTESVSTWTVKWDKVDFLGKQALRELEKKSEKRREFGIILIDKGIAREGHPVFKDGNPIGKVTSGTLSPSLKKSIAIILVEGAFQTGDLVEVLVRNNPIKAKIVKLPFYNPEN